MHLRHFPEKSFLKRYLESSVKKIVFVITVSGVNDKKLSSGVDTGK